MRLFRWLKNGIENLIGFIIAVIGVLFFICFGSPEEKDYKDDK